jgi:hypothetical protein
VDFPFIAKEVIEVILALTMPIGILYLIRERIKREVGISPNYIKFGGAILIVPLFGILAIERIFEPATIAALLGSITGYLIGTSTVSAEKRD